MYIGAWCILLSVSAPSMFLLSWSLVARAVKRKGLLQEVPYFLPDARLYWILNQPNPLVSALNKENNFFPLSSSIILFFVAIPL
jgi:hypothetical protein